MQEAGQKSPEYHTNAFMLQTIICNEKNPTICVSNLTIRSEKADLNTEKLKKETVIALLEKQRKV